MLDLFDKLILFIACIALYVVDAGYAISVTPIIVALTISSLNSYFDNKVFRRIFFSVYILICFKHQEFLVLLPLICYDMFWSKDQFLSSLAVLPFITHFNQCSFTIKVLLIIFFAISFFLKHRTHTLSKMHSEFTKFRDTSKELSILMETRNRDLLEKQDYEINVATLNERNRIAREIHDNVGHLLSRCLLQIGAIMAINKNDNLKDSLTAIKDTLSQAMNSIRSSVHNLHDESIDLYSQINGLVTNFTFCPIHLDYDISNTMDTKLKYCLIAIVKEALSNIIKHSEANEVNVALREHPALYQLIIQDNGVVSDYSLDNGIGLRNITERVTAFKGNIYFKIDNGFKIFISIPKL